MFKSQWLVSFTCILLFFSCALCDECFKYDFEEDFESLFNNGVGVCNGMNFWSQRNYSSITMESPHPDSKSFISPLSTMSCVSSPIFAMTVGGVVEVNIFMDVAAISDQITLFVSEYVPGGNDAIVATITNTPQLSNFVRGWHTLRTVLIGPVSYNGYLSLMGMASSNSIVLVDSLRYIPPSMDESMCVIYEGDVEADTTTETPELTSETEPPTSEINLDTTPSTIITENITQEPESETSSQPDVTDPDVSDATTDDSTDTTDSTDVTDSTDNPIIEDPSDTGFWNALTITMAVLIAFIILVVVVVIFYGIGKRRNNIKNAN